jgi:hypothetical protein
MNSQRPKIFPKLKKKLIQFLSDESGKVQKKDMLAAGIGGVMLVGGLLSASQLTVSAATAAECHTNGSSWDEYWATHSNIPAPGYNCTHNSSFPHSSSIQPETISSGHLSWYAPVAISENINGHYNAVPTGGGVIGRGAVNAQAAYHADAVSHSNYYDLLSTWSP